MISITSATFSILSSSAVIYFVLRSRTKLSKMYHRIIFFLSFFDVLGSLMIALSTLPMPKDVMYPFDGIKLGNVSSCQCQAFILFSTILLSIWTNASLNVYYLCTIRYKMKEESFKKIAQPLLLLFGIILTFPPLMVLQQLDLLNPSPFNTVCSFGVYPGDCTFRDEVPCLRGNENKAYDSFARLFFLLSMASSFGVIIISMALIVSSVHGEESTGDLPIRTSNDSISEAVCQVDSGLEAPHEPQRDLDGGSLHHVAKSRRVIFHQAIMYICAFFITWIFTVLTFAWEENWALQILKCIFTPLQGFFNALIFFSHKICHIRRSHGHIPFTEALYIVLTAPSEVPEVLLSRIDLVRQNDDNRADIASAISPYSGDAISLQTPSPSIDLSKALSSAGVSYGSKDESFVPMRGYYNVTLDPVEAAARLEGKKIVFFGDDESMEVIKEDEECSMASNMDSNVSYPSTRCS